MSDHVENIIQTISKYSENQYYVPNIYIACVVDQPSHTNLLSILIPEQQAFDSPLRSSHEITENTRCHMEHRPYIHRMPLLCLAGRSPLTPHTLAHSHANRSTHIQARTPHTPLAERAESKHRPARHLNDKGQTYTRASDSAAGGGVYALACGGIESTPQRVYHMLLRREHGGGVSADVVDADADDDDDRDDDDDASSFGPRRVMCSGCACVGVCVRVCVCLACSRITSPAGERL